MSRFAMLAVTCASCATNTTVTTPAAITIEVPATDGFSAHSITHEHSAFALVTATSETVVFTDAPIGTDCDKIPTFVAQLTVSGSTPGELMWRLDLGADGGGAFGGIAMTKSFDIDLIETAMSGSFATSTNTSDGRQALVSVAFDAPFCDGARWPPP
ncbi:hypothetical protein BH11MYX1_BH11MYX1_56170 [soil metagenome]